MGLAGRVLMMAALLAVPAAGAAAQDAADIKAQNLNALGTAMARQILAGLTDGKAAPESIFGILTDLDTDGYPEVFAVRPAADCTGPACGPSLFSLAGEATADLFGPVPEARTTPLAELGVLDQKRAGWFDMRFGQTDASWRGDGYAPASSFPASTLDLEQFTAVCEANTNHDFQLERAGVEPVQGRKTVCACAGRRLETLGFDQTSLDAFLARARSGDETELADPAGEAAASRIETEMYDITQGCMVQQRWAAWDWPFTRGDPEEAQVPLSFDVFIAQCNAADWLDANRHVGSAARRLGTCGCVARRLAASGFDQPALDAVGKLYGGEFSEADVEAARADALDISDAVLDRCLAEAPAVAAKAAD